MKASEIINFIEKDELDNKFLELYIDKNLIVKQKQRYIEAIKKYIVNFGDNDIEIYSVPGRSEICGNHTDHQKGEIIAAAINLDILAIVSKNDNDVIIENEFNLKPVNIYDLKVNEQEKGTSEGLIRGVLAKLKALGYKIGGFNAYMCSDVLQGSGMSSSAAFEVMIGTIISGLYNDMQIDSFEIAKVSQYSENEYFGKPCGLMDQSACSIGGLININFGSKDVKVNKLTFDFAKYNYSLCIVDVHASHADLTEDYAAIPKEMKEVANALNGNVLNDVDEQSFYDNIKDLRLEYGDRAVLRTIHYFEENKRVKKMVKALENDDFTLFKKLVSYSGNSSYKYLQNIYSNQNVKQQSVAIALALSEKFLNTHEGVCRVHGGGFAGTIQVFISDKDVLEYKKYIEQFLGDDSCHILKIRQDGGVRVI